MGEAAHQDFKARMFKQSQDLINQMDAVLVLNYDKEKDGVTYENYIGGATFLEMYEAFCGNKQIYMMNPVPLNILYDEIVGFNPIILNGDLNKIKGNVYKNSFDLEDYLMWLSRFSETFPEFNNESTFLLEDPVVTESDKKEFRRLGLLFNLLEHNVPLNYKVYHENEEVIKFKFDSVGYKISFV